MSDQKDPWLYCTKCGAMLLKWVLYVPDEKAYCLEHVPGGEDSQ